MRKRDVAGPLFLCVGVILCLAAVSSDASAERFHFQWSTRLSASEEYDDNVTLSTDDREHDWITRLTPGLTLSLLTEETEANLSYDFSLTNYARNDEQSGINHFLTLSGFQGIRVAERVTLDLDAVLQISEDPFEIGNPGEDVTDVSNIGNRYYRTTLGGRAHYFFGPEDSVYGGFTYQMLLNEDSGVEDRREYLPVAGLNYWFTVKYGCRVDYTYSKADFDVSENYEDHVGTASFIYRVNPRTEGNLSYTYDRLAYDGPRLGYAVHTATLGLSHQFSGPTSGSISGGYFTVVPEEGEDNGHFTGSFSLTRTSPRSTLSLDVASGYRRQFFQTENLGLSLYGTVSANFTYQLMERLSAYLTGAYFRDEYLETDEERKSDNWVGGTGLDYVLLRWLSGSIRYEYRQRQSNTEEDEYVDNRVTVTFTAIYSAQPRPL